MIPVFCYRVPTMPEMTERGILNELFANTNGLAWLRKSNWGSSLQLDIWEGVTFDESSGLSELALAENNLSGEFKSSQWTIISSNSGQCRS